MNPNIPADYGETGRWLRNFVISHAKREDSRIEAQIDMGDEREGRSYGFRLILGANASPPPGTPALEFSYAEVLEGRTRFAWCEALAQRIRTGSRLLAGRDRSGAQPA